MQVLNQTGLPFESLLDTGNAPVDVGFHFAHIGGPLGGLQPALPAI